LGCALVLACGDDSANVDATVDARADVPRVDVPGADVPSVDVPGTDVPGSDVLPNDAGSELPPGLVFASEWSTATGSGDDALLDSGRTRSWTELAGTAEVRVTADDGFDFPTTQYLVVPNDRLEIRLVPARGGDFIPLVSPGESIYLRFYIRGSFTYTGPGEAGSHGIYFDDDQTMGTNWGPNVLGFVIDSSPTDAFSFGVSRTDNPYDFDTDDGIFHPPGDLDNGTVYRLESRYTLESASEYSLGMRIDEGESTSPLYDTDDFTGRDFGSALRTEVFTHLLVDSYGPNGMQGMVVGVEAGQPGTGDLYSLAALAISAGPDADWLGPYDPAEATF